MIAKVNLQYGKASYQFEIEEKDEMDTLNKIITLGNPPHYCDVCQAKEGFYLTTNKDKEGNTYVNAKCVCGSRAKLGRYKTGGFFWRAFEKYEINHGVVNEEDLDF